MECSKCGQSDGRFLCIGDACFCVTMPKARHSLSPKCHAYSVWDPEAHCVAYAPPGSHSPLTNKKIWQKEAGRWLCDAHRWFGPSGGAELEVACARVPKQHQSKFQPGARTLLLDGMGAALSGPDAADLIQHIIVENVKVHCGGLPSKDACHTAMWAESVCDQKNACSSKVASGLDKLLESIGKTVPAQQAVCMCLVASLGACRFGSRDWCDKFLSSVSKTPEALLSHKDLSSVAYKLIDHFVDGKDNPMTLAHQPQKRVRPAVAKYFREIGSMPERHCHKRAAVVAEVTHLIRRTWHYEWLAEDALGEVDGDDCVSGDGKLHTSWPMSIALAPLIAEALLKGEVEIAAQWCLRIKGWGGSGLLVQTPLRHTIRAMVRNGFLEALPEQYYSFSWPGPGARKCLDRLEPPAAETPDPKRARLAYYTAPYSPKGVKYMEKMKAFHEDLVEKHGKLLQELTGAPGQFNSTQSGLCFAEKYCSLRGAVLGDSGMPANFRFRADRS